jgi:ubiquinol-cytochrome c reductase cytochrome b subunit
MMKALCSWFNDRTGVGEWSCRLAESPVPGRACFCKVLPCTIGFAFCVQAITGFFLWAYYSPSAQTAWESVYFLQYEVAGGWLLRAIHHYSAHVLLAMLILYVVQSILSGAYRAPRELVFWAIVGMGLCALAAVLTGDLLSWDQNGYASTKTRTGFLTFLPLVGSSLLRIAIGGPGPALGHLTLTRFFALHVGLFAAAFLLLAIVRGLLARRANALQVAEGFPAVPYWPAQAGRVAVACLAVMAVVVALACQHGMTLPNAGTPLLSPADTNPANAYDAARPEWFLVGVYEFSHLFPGQWAIVPIFIVPGLVLCLVLAMPFLARRAIGQVFNVAVTVALLIGVVAMSYHSLAKDRADPAHQKSIAVEQWQAQRVCELIRQNQGIPPVGALSLLRNDPKVEGRRLFVQYCATCHNHGADSDVAEIGEDVWTDKSTAPNLSGFASRRYLTGLLDPKQIGGSQYFGKTNKMVAWVKDNLADLNDDEQADLKKAIMALSAEAKLPAQQEADAKDAKSIQEGRKLILASDGCLTCTDCHKFHDKGKQGDAPNLTGYGSAEWITGVIHNPAAARFYGKLNDRMPAYAASTDDPSQNTLTARQIELLTDWLRGQWWEEERE